MKIDIQDLPDGQRATEAGLYRMPAAWYHADPAPEPSLSSSLIPKLALPGSSPKHVYLEHPRLGKPADAEDESDAKMSFGSVAHELLLGQGGGYDVCDVKDWKTNAAKELKAEAIANGLTPIKRADYERAMRMADTAVGILDQFEETRGLFGPEVNTDQSEVVGIFQCPRTGIWGRFMIDRWPTPFRIYDLKTTLASLDDNFIQRQIDDGLGARAWWYLHGLTTLEPKIADRLRYRWIFIEQKEPHEVLIREPDERHLYLGERQAMHAALRFRHCLKTGVWPGFPREIQAAKVRTWSATDWFMRETYSPEFRDVSSEALKVLSPWSNALAGIDEDAEITA